MVVRVPCTYSIGGDVRFIGDVKDVLWKDIQLYYGMTIRELFDLEEEISKLDVTNGESLFGNTINVTINAMSTTFGAISTYKEQDTTFDMISTYEEEDAKFDEDIKYYSTINSHSPS